MWQRLALGLLLLGACNPASSSKPSAPEESKVEPTHRVPQASATATAEVVAPALDTEARGRHFVELLSSERFAEAFAEFDEKMTAGLPQPQLEKVWRGLTSAAGAFVKIEQVKVVKVGAYETAIVGCVFGTTNLDAKVAFDAQGKVAGLFFSPGTQPYSDPAYVDRSRFDELEVTVGQGSEWELPGVLTLPKGKGPFRAVVLVHGSGPNDRDESVGANRPFKDLASGLASLGIAVLRYDKRTKVHGAKFAAMSDATIDGETIDDAVAAVELLRKDARIDAKHIVVVGHSLGGMLAPAIGLRSKELAGVASLAGSVRPMLDLMLEQVEKIAALDGHGSAEERAEIEKLRQKVEQVRAIQAGKPTASGDELVLGARPTYWKHLAAFDPLKTAAAYRKPMFFAQGERDYQVTKVDFDLWKRELGGRKDVRFKLYPKANHLFGEGEGPSGPEEYQRRSPVTPELIKDLADWLTKLP